MSIPLPELSPRLKLLYSKIPENQPFYDMCCDHGYIALHAFQNLNIPKVIAVDIVPNIIRRIRTHLPQYFSDIPEITERNFTKWRIEKNQKELIGFSHGAENLKNIQGTLMVAGVGTHTLLKIFQAHKENSEVKRWILSTHTDNLKLRQALQKSNWKLIHENIVYEKHYREVLVLERNGYEIDSIWNGINLSQTENLAYLEHLMEACNFIKVKGGKVDDLLTKLKTKINLYERSKDQT